MADPAQRLSMDQLLDEYGPELNKWFDERFDEKMAEQKANKKPSMALIATKGTMDWAYPPFILASTAAALDWDVKIFFTFYGLNLLRKDLHLNVSALGNPAMPMKMPFGPDWFQKINWNMPNAFMANMPGFETMATKMMEKTVKNKGVATIPQLRSLCLEAGVKFYACQMTVDLFSFKPEDFIDEVEAWVGAASYLPMSQEADVSLFI